MRSHCAAMILALSRPGCRTRYMWRLSKSALPGGVKNSGMPITRPAADHQHRTLPFTGLRSLRVITHRTQRGSAIDMATH